MGAIDLNADLGEGDPYDAELLTIVSSCNIACGGHAGDADSMTRTVNAATTNDVAIGAHPSYPDREGFGRRAWFLVGDALTESLIEQMESLVGITAANDARMVHVKPHGALYGDAAKDASLAMLVAHAVASVSTDLALVGPPASKLHAAAFEHQLPFVAEAFVDRAYNIDGSLVSRANPGAVHESVAVISAQALSIARDHKVMSQTGTEIDVLADTLCIHGDTVGADAAARAVRDTLTSNGFEIRSGR